MRSMLVRNKSPSLHTRVCLKCPTGFGSEKTQTRQSGSLREVLSLCIGGSYRGVVFLYRGVVVRSGVSASPGAGPGKYGMKSHGIHN